MKGVRPGLAACSLLAAAGCMHGGVSVAGSVATPHPHTVHGVSVDTRLRDAPESVLPEAPVSASDGTDTATLTIEPEPSLNEPSSGLTPEATQADTAREPEAVQEPEPTYDAVFSEEDVERWTQEEAVLSGPLALYGAVVLQKVRDYDRWRGRFDQQLQAREQAGFVAQGVMRGVDDAHLIAVWLAVTDVAQAKSFFASAWRRLGVKARVKLSRNLAAEIEPGRQGLSAAIVTLKVEELPEFRVAFDATAQSRAKAGLVGYSLGQDVDHEEIVYAYLQSEQPEALKAYLSSRETRRIWKQAGVLQIQSVTLVREGELMRCR